MLVQGFKLMPNERVMAVSFLVLARIQVVSCAITRDRLVECTSLKRAIEVVYSAILPKASKPFIYMSISLPPEHVDVNVHPTKREVSLLNQESLVDCIQSAVEAKLMHSNITRTFYTQLVLGRDTTGIRILEPHREPSRCSLDSVEEMASSGEEARGVADTEEDFDIRGIYL
eukprot:Gb_27062 [translate_table: standard]